MSNCHCGSAKNYNQCCEPIISGEKFADSAEQLMRARYSAYVTAEVEFLEESLHPDSRSDFDANATKQWAESSEWKSLSILDKTAGTANDKVGIVAFCASYIDENEKPQKHNERAHFKKLDDKWYFCDGQLIQPDKVGRNDPCTCGSGKKYKKCCGA